MGKLNCNKSPKPDDAKTLHQEKVQNKETMPSVHACANFPKKKKNRNLISTNWTNLAKALQLNTTNQSTKRKTEFFNNMKKNLKEAASSGKKSLQSQENEIWFDNVSEELLDLPSKSSRHAEERTSIEDNPLIKVGPHQGPTKVIALDCEMVGTGENGKESILARVSMVNSLGYCIYDKYVKPREIVTDYRTHVSGIREEDIKHGEEFEVVQKEVFDLLKGRLLVGHAVHHDLKVLFLEHPRSKIRDTSRFKYFRQISGGKTPSLKRLAGHFLGVKVQQGEHSSVQDAQAAMRLYTMHRKKWEKEIRERFVATTKRQQEKR